MESQAETEYENDAETGVISISGIASSKHDATPAKGMFTNMKNHKSDLKNHKSERPAYVGF